MKVDLRKAGTSWTREAMRPVTKECWSPSWKANSKANPTTAGTRQAKR